MSASRVTLPEEFLDLTSAKLLAQPEPQYPYAHLFKSALAVSLMTPDEIGFAGREIQSGGAPYVGADVDRLILSGPVSSQLFAAEVDFTKTTGHTMRFNRPQFADTVYTETARQVKSNQTISTDPIEISSEQATLTLKRYAGPYDSANSRVAPLAVEAFDAPMAMHKMSNIVGTQLQRDHDKFLDSVWVTLFDNSSASSVYPEGMTADDDATTLGQFGLTYEQISRTDRLMNEAHLPKFADGKRLMVVTSAGKKQLKDDPQYARYAEFHKEMNPLFPGYFGSLPEFHLCCSETLTKSANSSSVPIHRAQAMAPGVALGGMGRTTAVRQASDDNYGETPKVIWLGDYAFGLADARFTYSVRYSADV